MLDLSGTTQGTASVMEPNQNSPAASGSYLWEAPGNAASVYLDYDVVDRLGFEIMRGFGAVPRRGAEVGGLLLGSCEGGDRLVVRIEDYVPIACEHLRGPSYMLSEADLAGFDEALERWAPAPDKRIYVTGYYRSNTREALQLVPEDIALLDSRFQQATAVCLLVRPFATRPSEATFLLRRNGSFSTDIQERVFPFRRRELGGGKPARRPRGIEMDPELEAAATGYDPAEEPAAVSEPAPLEAPTFGGLAPSPQPEAPGKGRSKYRSGWIWIPLSFVFLLLGVVLGFQIALSYKNQQPPDSAADPYLLDLTVVQFGPDLHLKWNVEAAAFRNARRGLLYIQDGDNSKTVELKQEDLSRGGVLYRHATSNVKFRLEIFPRERNSIAESLELRLLESAKAPESSPGAGDAALPKSADEKKNRRRRR
ncbi:MAG: hypothetical protein HY858_08205 [Candidatus Solibacter usitatus]|nr:hypothetical protein [Candidatus Solibacter usitatus]